MKKEINIKNFCWYFKKWMSTKPHCNLILVYILSWLSGTRPWDGVVTSLSTSQTNRPSQLQRWYIYICTTGSRGNLACASIALNLKGEILSCASKLLSKQSTFFKTQDHVSKKRNKDKMFTYPTFLLYQRVARLCWCQLSYFYEWCD